MFKNFENHGLCAILNFWIGLFGVIDNSGTNNWILMKFEGIRDEIIHFQDIKLFKEISCFLQNKI